MKRFNKSYLIPITLGIIIFTVITSWLLYETVMFGDRTMRIIMQEGQITSKAIKGIIQSQIISGKISKHRLEYILNNIVGQTILKYACIKNGKKIIYKSDNENIQDLLKSKSFISRDNTYYFTQKLKIKTLSPLMYNKLEANIVNNRRKRILNERRLATIRAKEDFKKHPEDFVDFSHSTQNIIIGIDISLITKQLKTEFKKSLILYFITCASIIVFILSWIYMLKNSKLKLKYAAVKIKTDKLEELNLAATGLAHEIKNPLGIIRGLSQKIADNSENKIIVDEIAEKIIDEADIATERLSDFMNYAKQKTPSLQTLNIKSYIQEILEMLQYEFDEKNIVLITNIENLNIVTDHEFLNQIIINILMNSINACNSNDTVKITVYTKNNQCIIEISDNGPGINKELLADIFKPYVSGTPKGHGIGLAIVKKLIEELGWIITVESTPGSETKTRITTFSGALQ